jgi:hypothetical protein
MTPTEFETDAFYRSASLGLAWLDAREPAPRRFGPSADASWRNYAGQPAALTEVDRLELLLRDAATLHPDAFGPRAVFAIDGLTDDEPFGQWTHTPAPGLARDVLRREQPSTHGARALLEEAARAWGESVGAHAAVPSIGPTTRVLCAGASALAAVVVRFEADRALDVAEQVLVVTDRPALRQLAGLAGLALGARVAPRCFAPSLAAEALRGRGVSRLDVLVSSDDATTQERAAAEAWLAAFGR